jgi:GNAT superfamily N-acetyltransferase
VTAVRLALDEEVDRLCSVLARAFADDPVSAHLIPGPRRRPGGLRAFFSIQMRQEVLPFGGAFTTDDLAGAALWVPPGRPPTPMRSAALALLPVVPYVAGRHLGRTVAGLVQIASLRPREPHWYLATLGTDPSRQRQGVGSALLAPVLARCDAEGARAYLESSKEANLPFYRRHGFEVSGQVRLAGGPTVWTMWREPRPPA